MKAIMIEPHLQLRGSIYYFRIAAPKKLAVILGFKEYKKSLKTKDYTVARRKSRIISHVAETAFQAIEGLAGDMPNDDLKKIAKRYFEKCLLDASEELIREQVVVRGDSRSGGFNSETILHMAENSRQRLGMLRGQKRSHTYGTRQKRVANYLIDQKFIKIRKDSENYHAFCYAILRAQFEAERINLAYLEGNEHDGVIRDPSFKDCRNFFENPDPESYFNYEGLPSIQAKEECALSECIESYIEDRRNDVKASTIKAIRGYMGRLCDILGADKPMHSIQKQPDGILLEKSLKKIPAHYVRDYRSKGIGLMDVINNEDEYRCIDDTTAASYWMYFDEFFNYAVNRDYVAQNPIQNMKFKRKKKYQDKARHKFSDEQLTKIFHSSIYAGRKNKTRRLWEKGNIRTRDGYFWLPLIALYTGMREGEILYLTADDIKEENGIVYFDINNNEDKNVKTGSGVRCTPIHDELLKIGLKSYIEKRKKTIRSGERLFGEGMTIPKKQEITKNYSRNFGEYTVRIGVREKKDGKEVFHSFRHNLNTALSEAGVTNTVRAWIVGHKPPKETETEGDRSYLHTRPELEMLYEMVNKVDYGLDLSHLYED